MMQLKPKLMSALYLLGNIISSPVAVIRFFAMVLNVLAAALQLVKLYDLLKTKNLQTQWSSSQNKIKSGWEIYSQQDESSRYSGAQLVLSKGASWLKGGVMAATAITSELQEKHVSEAVGHVGTAAAFFSIAMRLRDKKTDIPTVLAATATSGSMLYQLSMLAQRLMITNPYNEPCESWNKYPTNSPKQMPQLGVHYQQVSHGAHDDQDTIRLTTTKAQGNK